jgi:hypothetical protein
MKGVSLDYTAALALHWSKLHWQDLSAPLQMMALNLY